MDQDLDDVLEERYVGKKDAKDAHPSPSRLNQIISHFENISQQEGQDDEVRLMHTNSSQSSIEQVKKSELNFLHTNESQSSLVSATILRR